MKIITKKIQPKLSHHILSKDSFNVDEVITYDIYIKKDKNYVIIIEAGTLISQELYKKLMKQENLYIDVKDLGKDKLTYKNLKNYIKYHVDDIKKALDFIYKINDEQYNTYLKDEKNQINIDCIEHIVDTIIFLINVDRSLMYKIIPFFRNDKTIATHSLHVAFYAINLGVELGFNTKKLIQLGSAAILHDLGYKKIDQSILNKDNKLTQEETVEIQKHVQYTIDILKQNQINDSYVIEAIMHHHERYDGSGYPEGLMAENMSEFASILAICDVFDALTNHRPYRKEFSSFDALKLMLKDPSMENKFNKEYLKIGVKLL